eukprot:12629326-Heterocapsa_arctica.AAC.1
MLIQATEGTGKSVRASFRQQNRQAHAQAFAHARQVRRKWRRDAERTKKRGAAASEAVNLSFGWSPQAGLAKHYSGASLQASLRLELHHRRC